MGSPVIDCLGWVFEHVLRGLLVLGEFLFKVVRFLLLRVLDVVCLVAFVACLGRENRFTAIEDRH